MTFFSRYRTLLLSLTGLLVAGGLYYGGGESTTTPGYSTRHAVWTWGRQDDLRFLPADVVVAAVDTAIEVHGTQVSVRPGTKRLQLAPGAVMLPVVHVDAFGRWEPVLEPEQEAQMVNILVKVLNRHGGSILQVDFEALPSQRASYTRILQALRARAPNAWISITALTSWCFHDKAWLETLPVNEVVPMAFRLGEDAPTWRAKLAAATAWPTSACKAQGVATDEPPLKLPATGAVYYFSPKPWSPGQWQLAKDRLQ